MFQTKGKVIADTLRQEYAEQIQETAMREVWMEQNK